MRRLSMEKMMQHLKRPLQAEEGSGSTMGARAS